MVTFLILENDYPQSLNMQLQCKDRGSHFMPKLDTTWRGGRGYEDTFYLATLLHSLVPHALEMAEGLGGR